jgi:mono/diheme cytochrome c family protein
MRLASGVCLLLALIAAATARAASIGRPVGDFVFQDLSGKRYTRAELRGGKAVAFLFLSTECPVSKRYGTRVASLAREYAPRGVRWFVVNANRQESAAEVARDAQERGFPCPVVKDTHNRLADVLGARMTPEAVVLDSAGVLRYRGRIDDNVDLDRVQSQDLRLALDALIAGQAVPRAEAPAFGCAIRRETPHVAKGIVTFTRDVAPILQERCQSCHRPGEVGPFPLLTYEQAAAWAPEIKRTTAARLMPPWKAAHGFGEFLGERRMQEAEIATIARWVDAGAPEGDRRAMPPPRTFPQGWALGEPDMVLEPEATYHLAAEGRDVYRNFVLPVVFKEERWVTATEVAAQNRAIVHHVIAYIDPEGQSVALDAQDPEPGFTSTGAGAGFSPALFLGGWAPGNKPHLAAPGTAVRIPAGSRLVLQVHYHKSGKPETDRTRIGLHLAKGPVEKRIRIAPVLNQRMEVPAGAARQEVTATMRLPMDAHAYSITPHMHLLGREMKVTATLPDGTVKPLIWIPDWNFNWQETYLFREPVALPRGTKIDVTAYYDNSEQNPNNPNRPPKTVRWGEETTDEMCIAFLTYTVDSEHLTQSAQAGAPSKADAIESR